MGSKGGCSVQCLTAGILTGLNRDSNIRVGILIGATIIPTKDQ